MTNAPAMAMTEVNAWSSTAGPAVSGNVTYTFGPTRTILGVPIDVFSYIFLGIAGAAPVVFIITVVISMKCYSYHRRKRIERLRNASQIGMELWEAERTFHINGKFQHAYDGPALSTLVESPSSEYSDSLRLKASNSNPNVFFKGQGEDCPDSTLATSVNPIGGSTLSLPVTVHTLNSEERQALECFDMIYEGLDSLSGTESIAMATTFRYPHPLYDKTKNGFKLPSSSKLARKFSLKSFPSQLKVEVESHTLPARTSKRHPADGNHLLRHPNNFLAHTLSQMPKTVSSPPVSVSDIASLPSTLQRNHSPGDSLSVEGGIPVPSSRCTSTFPPPPSTLPPLSPIPSQGYPTPEVPPLHSLSQESLAESKVVLSCENKDNSSQVTVRSRDSSDRPYRLVPRKSWLYSSYTNPGPCLTKAG